MNEKCLALFIHEILIILYGNNISINQNIVYYMDDFIYRYYQDNKQLFSVIFSNTELLETFIKNNYQILPFEVVAWIFKKYYGTYRYAELVDSVDPEKEKEVNKLVLLFIEYYNELIELSNKKTTWYQRILQ